MKRFTTILCGLVVAAGASTWISSCSKDLACGAGTVELNGQCVAGTPVAACNPDAGDMVVDGICVPHGAAPNYCGQNATFNPATGKCEGTGGGGGCSQGTCSAPGSSTVCVTGFVKGFIDEQKLNSTSGATVRVYDPIAFVSDPSTPPIGSGPIGDDGCYLVDGVNRPNSGLIAVGIDDTDTAGTVYRTMGVGAILQPNKNVTNLTAYALKETEYTQWQTDLDNAGMGQLPQGCSNGLAGCGVWIGQYFAKDGMTTVEGVTPNRPGDPINTNGNLFCFTGSTKTAMHLSAMQKTTGPLGMCVISPDDVIGHNGICSGSCKCNGTTCNPQPMFTSSTGGTAGGIVFYQPFTSTM